MTDSVNKVNYGPRYKKTTSDRRTSINAKDSKNERSLETKGEVKQTISKFKS